MGNGKFLVVAIVAALVTGPAFAGGDAKKGEVVFKRCTSCHTVEPGKHKLGPSLAGVVGRKAGTAKGFKKYKALNGADYVWDEANLDKFLADPNGFTGKKTTMTLKLKKPEERADVIAYLKTK